MTVSLSNNGVSRFRIRSTLLAQRDSAAVAS